MFYQSNTTVYKVMNVRSNVSSVDQKYFWTWNKITQCSAVFIDPIFTTYDFPFSKNDQKIISVFL